MNESVAVLGNRIGPFVWTFKHSGNRPVRKRRPCASIPKRPVGKRDLSPAKREMILNWLSSTGNAGKPNLDVTLPEPMRPPLVAAATPVEVRDDVMALGDKMAALQRRRNQLA